MNEEIEKMYKKLNIKKKYSCNTVCQADLNACPLWCKDCKNLGSYYPPVTAEKQIKLIDWFIKNESDIQINFDCDDESYYIKGDDKETMTFEGFAEALANLINIYFEGFTDEEIEEVKEILE